MTPHVGIIYQWHLKGMTSAALTGDVKTGEQLFTQCDHRSGEVVNKGNNS